MLIQLDYVHASLQKCHVQPAGPVTANMTTRVIARESMSESECVTARMMGHDSICM
jgi:hypothetical protein